MGLQCRFLIYNVSSPCRGARDCTRRAVSGFGGRLRAPCGRQGGVRRRVPWNLNKAMSRSVVCTSLKGRGTAGRTTRRQVQVRGALAANRRSPVVREGIDCLAYKLYASFRFLDGFSLLVCLRKAELHDFTGNYAGANSGLSKRLPIFVHAFRWIRPRCLAAVSLTPHHPFGAVRPSIIFFTGR